MRLGRLRAVDAMTLVAVATVVLLVSLPRLRDFALRQNESDARQMALRLVGLISAPVHAGELPTAGELVRGEPRLARELRDLEILDGGRRLRRHGYLFEIAPPGEGTPPTVRAWPWEHGRTGRLAFVAVPGGGLFVHPNAEGRWGGERRPPERSGADGGWALVR